MDSCFLEKIDSTAENHYLEAVNSNREGAQNGGGK